MIDTDNYYANLVEDHYGEDQITEVTEECDECEQEVTFEVDEDGEGCCPQCGCTGYWVKLDQRADEYLEEDLREFED